MPKDQDFLTLVLEILPRLAVKNPLELIAEVSGYTGLTFNRFAKSMLQFWSENAQPEGKKSKKNLRAFVP